METSESSPTIDDLPPELLVLIIRHLNYDFYHLSGLRRVSPKWRDLADIVTRELLVSAKWSLFTPRRRPGWRRARNAVAVLGKLDEFKSYHYKRTDGNGGQIARVLHDGLRGQRLRAVETHSKIKIVRARGTVIDIFSLPINCCYTINFHLPEPRRSQKRVREPNWNNRDVRRRLLGDYDLLKYTNGGDSDEDLHVLDCCHQEEP